MTASANVQEQTKKMNLLALILDPISPISEAERRNARLINSLVLTIIVGLLANQLVAPSTILWLVTALFVLVYALGRSRHYQVAGILMVILLSLSVLGFAGKDMENTYNEVGSVLVWTTLPILLASMFLSLRWSVIITGLNLLVIGVFPLVHPQLTYEVVLGASGFAITFAPLMLIAMRHRDRLEDARQAELRDANAKLRESEAGLERRVEERTRELTQARNEAEAARAEAEKANTIKSQFLASMSHELRTPLNAILNFSKLLRKGVLGPTNERQTSTLNEVVASGQHLLNLINDVLDVSKIQSGMLTLFVEEDVDLHRILTSVTTTTDALIKDKPVTLITDIDSGLPSIVCDQRRVQQVLLNLLSNAAKFTDEGTVTLSAKYRENEVLFAVLDTGSGIPEDQQETIFEPFIQTTTGVKHAGGTGLGLPISRSLVEAHGGRLWLESNAGEGSAFMFTLPTNSPQLREQLAAIQGVSYG